MSNPSHRLRRQMHAARHRGRGVARRQLLQDDGAQYDTNWLHPGSQELSDGLLIFPGHLKLNGAP
jgi:hypothetical protein